MLSEEQIDQLAAFDGRDARVLSVYLDLDPATQVRRSYEIALEDLIKTARARLDDASAREAFETEAARVQTWLDSEKPRGKGLAVVSCSPRNLWRADFLAVRVMNHLAFEPTPDVAPLLRIVDEYERYAVAVVDKETARLFTVFAGEIEAVETFEDYVPPHHKQGGPSQANMQRHHEAHVFRHLKRVAERLTQLRRKRSFDRLVIAGPVEATSELRRILPRALAPFIQESHAAHRIGIPQVRRPLVERHRLRKILVDGVG